MANGEKANFRNADLRNVDLRWTDFRWADLQKADLRGAALQGADLQGADLRRTNLSAADLRGADLRDADLRGADLDYVCWPLWCGTTNVRIDEKQARQIAAHCFSVIGKFWPGGITEEQAKWINQFHRIEIGDFPEIDVKR